MKTYAIVGRCWSAVALVGVVLVGIGFGAERFWDAANGAWSSPANWAGGAVPQANDTVLLAAAGHDGVAINDLSALKLTSLVVSNYNHTINMQGNALTTGVFLVHGIGSTPARLGWQGGGEVVVLSDYRVAAGVSGVVGPRVGNAATNGLGYVTYQGVALQVGTPQANAAMRVGFQNTTENHEKFAAEVAPATTFNGYLGVLNVGARSSGSSSSSPLTGLLDLSAVTTPGILKVAAELLLGGPAAAGHVVLSDAMDLQIGVSPASRAKLTLGNGFKSPCTGLTLGKGRFDAYISTLDVGSNTGHNYLYAGEAAGGVFDVSGAVAIGKQAAGAWQPNAIVELGDNMTVKIGSAQGRVAFDFAHVAGSHETNIFSVGASSFSAYLTEAKIGISSRSSTISGERSLVTFDLSRVTEGLLDIALGYRQGHNAAVVSKVELSDGFVTRLGAAAAPAEMIIGGGSRWVTNTFSAGGVFEAYLSNLSVGECGTEVGGGVVNMATLDLSRVTNGFIDVSGEVLIGVGGNNSHGSVTLPQIDVASERLWVGGTNGVATGALQLNGTVFHVSESARVDGPSANHQGRIDVQMGGLPAGLDLDDTATLEINHGVLYIVFGEALRPGHPYWGLRWRGDHEIELRELIEDEKIMWDDFISVRQRAEVFSDLMFTYLGFSPRPQGTAIIVR